jgi:predicted CXXCH cytochrome family protein
MITMEPAATAPSLPWHQRHRGKLGALLGALVAAILAVSCATSQNRTIVMPPSIGGATYLGSEACSQCHETYTKQFASAAHARLVASGPNAVNVGCESCHGPGSVHVESGGAARTIVNPGKNPETCFECHSNLRGQFALPNHHPVVEGRISCSSCHDSHRGDAMKGGGTALLTASEVCITCHKPQRGPHVFEHEAMREGCTTCHQPHGSVNQKMLTERNAVLCLKCHFQRQTSPGQIAIGAIDHTPFLSRGTCWTAGCHEAVHGSQVSNSLRF